MDKMRTFMKKKIFFWKICMYHSEHDNFPVLKDS